MVAECDVAAWKEVAGEAERGRKERICKSEASSLKERKALMATLSSLEFHKHPPPIHRGASRAISSCTKVDNTGSMVTALPRATGFC